jgi:hypothetical protein
MNLVARQVYGNKLGGIPNTFIGGVASTINTPALLATKLAIDVSRITGFSVVGSDIKCKITGSYELPNRNITPYNGFASGITYYDDRDGLVTKVNHSSFRNNSGASSLVWVNLPNCNYIDNYAFYNQQNFTTLTAPLISFLGDYSCSYTRISTINYAYCQNIGDSAFSRCFLPLTINLPVATVFATNAFSFSNISSYYGPNLTTMGVGCFDQCTGTPYFNMPNVTSVPINCFRYFSGPTFNMPLVNSIGSQAFRGNIAQTVFNFPEVLTTGQSCFFDTKATSYQFNKLTNCGDYAFNSCSNVTNIYMPKCAILGPTVLNDYIFNGIKTGCSITVKANLQTNNSGSPDGDLQYAITTRGATVNYV